jgi:hypothetical protein
MSMEDVVLVAMVREEIRGGALRVDAADIPRHVAKAEAQAQQAKLEAATKGKADAEAKSKTEAEANVKEAEAPKAELELEAEARAKHEAVKAKREALAKAKAEAEAKEKHEADVRAKAEVKAREKREAEAKAKADKAELRAMQAEEQIAKQKAAANASASSPIGGWYSKFTASAASAIIPTEESAPPKPTSLWSSDPWSRRHVKNASSPSTELGPLKGPRGPGAPVQHSSTTCSSSLPRESVFTHSATSITAAPPSASFMSSSPTLAQERKLTTNKQDGKRFQLTFLGKADDRKDKQATAALPAKASADVPNEAKSETAVATADKPVPSNTTDVSRTYHIVGGATAPDAPADKDAPTSRKAESTRAPETAPAEVVVDSRPSKDLDPASAFPMVMPCQPRSLPDSLPLQTPGQACLVPGGIALQTPHHWQSQLFMRRIPPEKDATMTKEHTPTPESAASVSARPETPTPNVPDAKNAGESPAETKASPTAPQDSVKPDGTATEPILRFSQYGEAGGWGFSITKGGDANLEGPSKPTTDHHIREVSTASAMTTSGPGAPVDDAPSSSLKKEDDGDPWGAKLTKAQMKRMREKARKQARMGHQRPSSGATSNSVDNSVVQEPKPVATALVDIPVGKGECVRVDARMESGRDDARVIVEKPDTAATAETAAAHADQW